MNFDGNWALAILSLITILASGFSSFIIVRQRVSRIEKSMANRVSHELYEERSKHTNELLQNLEAAIKHLEDTTNTKVSSDAYTERQRALDDDIKVLQSRIDINQEVMRSCESKVDALTGKIDALITMQRESYRHGQHPA